MTELSGRMDGTVAVVTGAAGGIGSATCRRLARAGATVVAVDVDGPGALALIEEIGGLAVEADVTAAEGVERALDGAGSLGGARVLVNNVGHYLYPRHDFTASTPDEWEALHRINLLHVLQACHGFVPAMVAAGAGGSIVNVTTIEAHRGIPQHVVYSAYKAAVEGFTRSLALEVGGHGIRVNNVAPDMTDSRQVRVAEWVTADQEALVRTWIPLGHIGSPDEVAAAIYFLASDLSSFMTGGTLHPDGGALVSGGWYGHPDTGWTSRPRDPDLGGPPLV